MKITEIYRKYNVNKGLQEHMVQVAAVAKTICDQYPHKISTEFVVSVCLLHDLGNLAKVKFNSIIEHGYHFEPEGVEYWKQKQAEVWQAISQDEHEVTHFYLKDLDVSQSVQAAVDQIGLSKIHETAKIKPIEDKVIIYADLRVGLHGVISARERMEDIKNRYVPDRYTLAEVEACTKTLFAIEKELFTGLDITPADITDESTAELQTELFGWEIETS